MSIIAVSGFPYFFSLKQGVTVITKTIKCPFEALNYNQQKGPNNVKTLYIRISEKMDPQAVLQRLSKLHIGSCKMRSYLPNYVPDLLIKKKKPLKKIPKMVVDKADDILVLAHREILHEMQFKYTGLYELSKKNGNTLLEEITHTIFERLKLIMDTNEQAANTIFNLTKVYRRTHPHFADFQLILSTLERVQDLAGTPRTQITEQDISVVNTQPCLIGNIPYNRVKSVCVKYSDAIVKKVSEHVATLKSEIGDGNTEEEIAKRKVRAELKKLTPYLSTIIKEVITDNFIPERSPYHPFRIYGEPFLPPKETMSPFLNRYKPVKVTRSDRMYNLLKMYISLSQYGSIMAMDGTVVGGAKLVIRPSDKPIYKIPESFVQEMRAAVTAGYKPGEQEVPENPKKLQEDWNEPWE